MLFRSQSAPRPAGSPPEIAPSGMNFSANFPKPMNFSYADLKDPRVIDNINNHLEVKLADSMITPYVGLERARKVLHPYGIVIPAVAWLNSDDGDQVFAVYQWGGVYGTKGVASKATDTIDTDLTVNPGLSVYFSWSYNDQANAYDIWCAVVNSDELEELDSDSEGTAFDDSDDAEDAMSESIDEACWKDYKQVGLKKKNGKIGRAHV